MSIPKIVKLAGFLIMLIGGCAWLANETPPDWIRSSHQSYPPERYLTGIGEAESRELAEKRAYAAVARVFSAKVSAQSMDYEKYSLQETDDRSQSRRELLLDRRTRVTTNKVLENVKVLDVWYQPSTRHFFAFAGLDRQQAEQAVLERLQDWDMKIDHMINQGRTHPRKIQRIRGYKEAIALLADRDLLNADLRIIRASGESLPSSYRIPQVQREFMDFVANEVVISVTLEGDNHQDMERAILEGLKQEGLLAGTAKAEGIENTDLAIVGEGYLWSLDIPDPLFTYVRWCGDIEIYETPSHRLIGVISETGREGHITEQEARVRANSAMQQVLSREVARLLTRSIFEDSDNEEARRKPKACPH